MPINAATMTACDSVLLPMLRGKPNGILLASTLLRKYAPSSSMDGPTITTSGFAVV